MTQFLFDALWPTLTGHLNTAFTQYVTEGPTVATVTNTGATTGSACVNMEQMSQPQTSIKETEL